jgi:prephenate dehydrogenase
MGDEGIEAIEQGDRPGIYNYFAAAKKRRDQILDKTEKMFEI